MYLIPTRVKKHFEIENLISLKFKGEKYFNKIF